MTKKGISTRKCNWKKQELQRILMHNDSSKFLSWVLVKVARNHFFPSRVSSGSGCSLKENSENHSKLFRGFRGGKKVHQIGLEDSISHGSLINKVFNSLTKNCAAMEVIAGTNRENSLESWLSFLHWGVHCLPETTAFLVVQNQTIIPTKCSLLLQRDFRLQRISLGDELAVEDAKPRAWTEDTEDLNNQNFIPCEEKFTLRSISIIRRELPQSTLGWPLLRRTSQSSEALSRRRERNMSVVEWVMSLPSRSTSVADQNHMIDLDTKKISLGREIDNSPLNDREIEGSNLQEFHTVEESTDDSRKAKDENLRIVSGQQAEVSLKTVSLNATNLSLSKPGWPFLRIEASMRLDSSRESEDAPLPNRSTPATPQSRISLVSPSIDYDENCFTPQSPGESEVFLRLVSSSCKKFSYMELKQATSKFSSGNLIGEGGCSNVYKGCLPNGKLVAVKVLKSYREAWNDFSLEVDITSSLMNKNITPLMGVCIEDSNLILVYDFLPKGSLEESLHGGDKSSALPWEMRYKVAVEIAEALNYLHNECLRPVIHRDVKSSNILLSTEFQPQLSDFGLAIWGPTDSSYIIDEDVVGTFGYIAPEYFMHGKVSDKIDVYSLGVVLLEMLSGRRPIDSKSLNGQESLVKWAKPILENGDTKELLDPSLNNDIDIAQMQRMVLAANLCISQSPRKRPKVSQIVKLLRGENDAKDLFDTDVNDANETGNQDDDDLLECGGRSYLDLRILDTDFDATSLSSVVNSALHFTAEQKQRFKLRDYLKMEQD